jgi:hypothetical protein
VLERQVDHAIRRGGRARQAVEIVKSAAVHLRSGRGEGSGRGIRAAEPNDLMARAEELGNDGGADPAGRTGDEYAHEKTSGGRPSSPRGVRSDGLMSVAVTGVHVMTAAVIKVGLGYCIIAANTELQERELVKLASLASAIADTLRRRGVTEPAATLTAEAGIAVFRIAFEHWVNEANQKDLPQLIRESFAELKAVTAGA